MRAKSKAFGTNERRHVLPLAATLMAALLVGLCGCQGFGALDTQVQRAREAAGLDRDHGQGRIHASGTIQADEIRIASEYGGRIVKVYVQAGERVEAGTVVASLDTTVLFDGERGMPTLAEAEAAVAAAQADLDLVRAGTRPEEVDAARAALSLAIARYEGARTAWENARAALEDPQELEARIIEAQTQVKLAEQAAILAQAELAKEELLSWQKREGTDERDIADWQVKAAKEALAAAQADQTAAQTLLEWLSFIRENPLVAIARSNAAQGQAQVAEAGVQSAQARLEDLQAGPMAQEIAVARGQVRLARAQAAVIRAQLDKFSLHTPVDGVVLDQVAQKGQVVAPAATVLTIAQLDPLKLTVYVPVNQIGQVHLAQQVQATVDSFPDRLFGGRVTRIGNEPEYTPRNVATQEERLNTFYAVDIRLDNPDNVLKPGMPADAVFALPAASPVSSE